MLWTQVLSDINLLAVLVAGVVHIVLGLVWFQPKLFGNVWVKLSGKEMKPATRWIPAGTLLMTLVCTVNVRCTVCDGIAARGGERLAEALAEKQSGGKATIDIAGSIDTSVLPSFLVYPGAVCTAKWQENETSTLYILRADALREDVVAWYKKSIRSTAWGVGTIEGVDMGQYFSCTSQDSSERFSVMIESHNYWMTDITIGHEKRRKQ